MDLEVGTVLTRGITDVHGDVVSGTIEKICNNVVIILANISDVHEMSSTDRYVVKKTTLKEIGYSI